MRRWHALLLTVACCAASPAGAAEDLGVGRTPVDAPANGLPARVDRQPTPIGEDSDPQAGSVDPRQYRVGPGDSFELRLWGRLTRTVPLTVDPEGRLHLPERAPLAVGDRTLEQVRADVLGALSEMYRGVGVDLKLVRVRRLKVYLTGELHQPGAVTASPVTRASEVIEKATLKDRASLRNIRVLHRDGTSDRVDLALLRTTGDTTLDPWLLDGDVVSVPVATKFVAAYGAFGRPGRFELSDGDSIATLIRLAGGFVEAADRVKANFTRFVSPTRRESLMVNLSAGTTSDATHLRDGDALFVPFIPSFHELHTVTILGEISSPGAYPIVLGQDRLSDLMAWAGGPLARADIENLHLVRRPPPGQEVDADFERLVKLSRNQMTEYEYSTLQLRLAERKNSFRVDWKKVSEQRRGSDLDLVLNDGDLLRVDPLVTSVRVDGQVRNPGLVEYVAGRSPHEYIRLAGGFTRKASRGVRLTRRGSSQVLPVSSVREVQPGDVIWVPEKRDLDPWGVLRDVLTIAGQLAVVIVAVRR